MKHHKYHPGFPFVVEPEEFNKYTDKELLQYCLGATMYMPGTQDFLQVLLDQSMPGLTSMVFCFEDACPEGQVEEAEKNVIHILNALSDAIDRGDLSYEDLPLIFCRVRSQEQFIRFAEQLSKRSVRVLTGINFPKFNAHNGNVYLFYLQQLNRKFGEILYGMPNSEIARNDRTDGNQGNSGSVQGYRAAGPCGSHRFFFLLRRAPRSGLFYL